MINENKSPALALPVFLVTVVAFCGMQRGASQAGSLPEYPGRASAPSFIASGYDSMLASADVLYGVAVVEKTAPGTFYAVLLGEAFYMGLQHGGSGYNKHVHCAVWDPADALVYRASGVDARRFGGEGTGWTIYYPFEWKTNVNYGFLTQITAAPPEGTLYRAYFYDPESDRWKHLATVRRNLNVPGLKFFGSFIEDFGERSWIDRSLLVGRQWARYGTNRWVDLRRGYFNCSIGWSNPYTNAFNGDVIGEFFRLGTGGATVRTANPGDVMQRAATVRALNLPVDPPQLDALPGAEGTLHLRLNGAPGLKYAVDSTSDFHSWQKTLTLTLEQPSQLHDVPSTETPQKFYRAALQQL